MLNNWFWVIIGHLIGGALYAFLYTIAVSQLGLVTDNALAAKLIAVAEAKTLGYASLGGEV